MKSFSKIIFFVIPLMTSLQALAQPCTPDVNFPYTQGTLPESIPAANLNVAYSQVIQFKAPLDTNIFYKPLNTTVAVKIDSLRITDVVGLPSGMSYQCHNNSCMVNGGQVGCIVLEGTTTESGAHPLLVLTRTSGKLKGTPPFPDIPQVQNDTNTRYTLFVNWPTGMMQIVEQGSIRLYPNPAKSVVSIEADFSAGTMALLNVYDITGKKVLEQKLSSNEYKHEVSISSLPTGMYSFTIVSGTGSFSQKMLIE